MEVTSKAVDYTHSEMAEYDFSEICCQLPQLSKSNFTAAHEIRCNSKYNEIEFRIIAIAKQLLIHFVDYDSVLIHKGSGLPHTLYLQPKKQMIFVLSGLSKQVKFSGGYKTGRPILCIGPNGIQQIVKLSNKKKHTIKKEEIEAALRYRDLPGFVPIFDYFSRRVVRKSKGEIMKSNEDVSSNDSYIEYMKHTFLLEQFKGNLNQLYYQPCTSKEIGVVFYHTALALQKLHSDGYVHGDIAPQNILFSTDENNKIVKAALWDFGFIQNAKLRVQDANEVRKKPWLIHNPRSVFYTPESLRHLYDSDFSWVQDEHDRKANDIYAFGMSMYVPVFKKKPTWYQKLLDLDIFNPLKFDTTTCEKILAEQEQVCVSIDVLEKFKYRAALEELQLLVLQMLHPQVRNRMTIEAVVIQLEKIIGQLEQTPFEFSLNQTPPIKDQTPLSNSNTICNISDRYSI